MTINLAAKYILVLSAITIILLFTGWITATVRLDWSTHPMFAHTGEMTYYLGALVPAIVYGLFGAALGKTGRTAGEKAEFDKTGFLILGLPLAVTALFIYMMHSLSITFPADAGSGYLWSVFYHTSVLSLIVTGFLLAQGFFAKEHSIGSAPFRERVFILITLIGVLIGNGWLVMVDPTFHLAYVLFGLFLAVLRRRLQKKRPGTWRVNWHVALFIAMPLLAAPYVIGLFPAEAIQMELIFLMIFSGFILGMSVYKAEHNS
ncbi:hypothetical protein [Alteribacter natronophilus]|uniref:hypothetical protein n=1 Tax=Alteribacter natronophilus TaxID=2583810 RepID=UPI00110E1FE0|nr:hypothetical protein [Alteribacter natronophilus]TMW72830.1 hypothetical protein FGB90_00515 [Alteribacter natronophilus]